MSEYIIEIPYEYIMAFGEELEYYYPDERHGAMYIEPIVRCRDCVHAIECFPGDCRCDREHDESDWYLTVDPDGFCAWGERRSK